uniref:DUF7667 family protein n=1 Tax=Paenibacillus sp. FSL F4-0243 TaxID=2954732 RepID=UPI00403F89B4
MLPTHIRLAELYHLHKAGKLKAEHGPELLQCLAVNARYCWNTLKLQQLFNLTISAEDIAWLNSLRNQEETLRLTRRALSL